MFASRVHLEDALRKQLLETVHALEAKHPGHSRPTSSQEPVVVRRMPVLERLPWRVGSEPSTAKRDIKCPASVKHNIYTTNLIASLDPVCLRRTPGHSSIDGCCFLGSCAQVTASSIPRLGAMQFLSNCQLSSNLPASDKGMPRHLFAVASCNLNYKWSYFSTFLAPLYILGCTYEQPFQY